MPRWIELQRLNDSRGGLLIAESQKNIPFSIERVYCLYGMNHEPRGFHAHKALQQVMVCLSGSCSVILDNGNEREKVELNNRSEGLFIGKMFWREMNSFSSDCVLMLLASEHYDEDDYIRNYDEFIKAIKGNLYGQ